MASARSAVSTLLAVVLAACAPNPPTTPPVTPVPRPIDLTPDVTPVPSATASPAPSVALPRLTWRRTKLPNTDFANVTRFDDRLYAIGDVPDGPQKGEAVWTSAEGVEWSKLGKTPFKDGTVTRLRSAGGRLFAIVRHSFEAEPFGISTSVWWSKDANRWTNVIPRVDGDPIVFDIEGFGGRWVATTTGPTGAITWAGTERPQDAAVGDATTFDRGRPIAVAGRLIIPAEGPQINGGNPSAVVISTADTNDWATTGLSPGRSSEVLSMASNGVVVVALGNGPLATGLGGSAAWWSTDGLTWERATMPPELLDGRRRVDAVAAYPGGFLGLSQDDAPASPQVIWSPDGRAWHLLERGPIGQIALPRALSVGDRVLFYLQPYEEVRWYLWEATPA